MKNPSQLMHRAELTVNSMKNNFTPEVVPPPDVLAIERELCERDYSENSRKAIRGDVRAFLSCYRKRTGKEFSFQDVTRSDVIGFRDEGKASNLAPATINRRLTHVRLFLDMAVGAGLLPENPAQDVRQVAMQKLAPRSLSEEELSRFIKQVELERSLRDQTMVMLMLEAGLRLSEVLTLSVSDVQISERKGQVFIRHSKRNKSREVPLKQEVRHMLSRYLSRYKPTDKLFLTYEHRRRGERRNRPMTHIGAHKMIQKYSERCGVKITAHQLRHCFAYRFLQKNPGDILSLSQILGHSNIQQSARYAMNTLEDLQRKMED